MSDEKEGTLSPGQVAERLGLSVGTVRSYRKSGVIPKHFVVPGISRELHFRPGVIEFLEEEFLKPRKRKRDT